MKSLVSILVCVGLLVATSPLTLAQTGWSLTDRNQDVSGLTQLVFRIDVNTGAITQLQEYPSRTEQEGLFSTGGSNLFGYSENDPALADTESQQPGVRLIPWPVGLPGNVLATGLIDGPNPPPGTQANVIGPICTFPGNRFGTESGAGYNPTDGFVYVVNSNDAPADGVVGSWFSRFKPNCLSYEHLGSGTLVPAVPDDPQYVDGLAVDHVGTIYLSDLRLSDRVYTFSFGGGVVTLSTCNVFNLPGGINRDSGLSWDFENNRLIALAENGVLYQVGQSVDGLGAGPCTPGWTQLATFSPVTQGDFEGFDIPIFDPQD